MAQGRFVRVRPRRTRTGSDFRRRAPRLSVHDPTLVAVSERPGGSDVRRSVFVPPVLADPGRSVPVRVADRDARDGAAAEVHCQESNDCIRNPGFANPAVWNPRALPIVESVTASPAPVQPLVIEQARGRCLQTSARRHEFIAQPPAAFAFESHAKRIGHVRACGFVRDRGACADDNRQVFRVKLEAGIRIRIEEPLGEGQAIFAGNPQALVPEPR